MRFGIRGKLVLLLTVVALVPLTAALIIITIFGRQLQSESVGLSMQSQVSAEALGLRVSFLKDVEKLRLALQYESRVPRDLASRTQRLTREELASRDALWQRGPATPAEAKLMADVIDNPISQRLVQVKQGDTRIAEILVTDRFGQLAAATGQASDFDQSDEQWWQGCCHDGQGRISVPAINYDHSSRVWSVDLCLPIYRRDEKDGQEKLVGVAKIVFDLSKLMDGVSVRVGRLPVSARLVRHDGKVIHVQDVARRGQAATVPLSSSVSEWTGPIAAGQDAGWRITNDGELQAFAPIRFADRVSGLRAALPRWSLVLSAPASKAMGGMRRLSFWILVIGLVSIVAIFLGGLLLVERSITRRLRRLEHATHRVAEGDLTHRIETDWAGRRIMGADEIDDVATDFNRMVAQVQQSDLALREGNELKTNFIQIASHELRTPVSYILGMTDLLKDCHDPARLARGVEATGAKARRLDEIIQAMFKLIGDPQRAEALDYRDVNVSELLEEVYADCHAFVEQRHQRLIVDPCEDIPMIRADSDKLRDVLENLVINAIKFTPDGGVIRITTRRQLGERVSLAVADQGPGIPEADLPHIFEPFFGTADVMKHSSGSVGYQKRGIGLGLTIAKRFVDLHHGSLHVSSGPQGSVFTVSIPQEPPPRDATHLP